MLLKKPPENAAFLFFMYIFGSSPIPLHKLCISGYPCKQHFPPNKHPVYRAMIFYCKTYFIPNNMRKFVLLSLAVISFATAFAQDFSNKGKDFYLCFPQHVPSGTNAKLSVWITSDKASTGTITMASGAFSSTFNIAANGLAEIDIPYAVAHISNSESTTEFLTQILKKSIRVKVDPGKPAVVAYVQQYGNARSAASLLLPVNVLGKKYFAISFNQNGGGPVGTNLPRSQFQVIAIKDNTVIQITPMKNGAKGTAFTVTLPLAGDMIQYQSPDGAAATQDLTGTLIESVASGSGGCLPIAVFSGSSNLTMGTQTPNCNGSSYDPLLQQLYPVNTWGKNFGFIPFANYPSGVPYRVMASEDNTNVYFNGTLVATLNTGQIYPAAFTANPVTLTAPTYISADKPICVAEYAQSSGCAGNGGGSNQGDPDMVILNPIEQNISDITIFSTKQQVINTQWINVLMKTVATPSFKISRNGCALAPPNGTWQPVPGLPGYSYLRELLPVPGSGPCAVGGVSDSYRLVADSGFNAIAYGLGTNETYAYSAGTYVKDNNAPGVSTGYGIENNKVCIGLPFKIKIPLPYIADSIYWDVSTLPGYTNTWTYYPPDTPDSITGTALRPIYWYSLPTNFIVNTAGTYVIKATTYSQNTDGCGNEQDVEFEIEVTGPPTANYTWSTPNCFAESVQFNDASTSSNPVYKWWWDFGDPASGAANNALTINPTHTFTAPSTPTTYDVRYVNITTPGCVSDTIHHLVQVAPFPTATIDGTNVVCLNAAPPPVTFTGSGSTAGSYTFYYHITPGGIQPPLIGATATINAPTNVAGTFVYTLDSVRITGSTLCVKTITGQQATITVNPLPTASISGTATVCQNAASPNITFTGAAATAPYTFSYTINGGPVQTVTTVAGNSVTVPVSTATAGIFTYTLVSVKDASSTACVQAQGGSAVVTVNPLPTASISGTLAVCKNAAPPNITFTGASGTAPYTFSYTINGGPVLTATTVAGNSVTVSVPTGTVGTFTYTLVSVQEGSSTLCSQAQTGSATITVNDLPTASIAGTIAVCQNGPQPLVTFTGANTTAPYTFKYTVNGGPIQTVTTVAGNSVGVPVSTAVPGVYTYALVSVQDGSSTACLQTQTGSAVVTVNPLPIAGISGSTSVCLNATPPSILFTGALGTAPYTFSYTINGGPVQTVSTVAGNSVTITAPTGTAGTYTYALVSVRDASSTTCSQNQAGSAVIVVNPLPTASVTGTTTVCQNAASPNVTFTGASATAPYTFSYRINGGPILTATTVAGNSVNVPASTAVVGTFTYTLVSVQDGSITACSQPQAGSVTITVNPLPTASISGTTSVCRNAASPNITFTGANTIAPYTFSYTINGGPIQTVTTVAGNSVTVSVPTAVAGTFTYTLISVQDASSTACSQAQGGSAIVTVNPLPTASISGTLAVCKNAPSPNITFTGATGTAPYTFSYTLNGGPVQTITTVAGNSVTLSVPTATVGTYTYALVGVQDGSSTTCSQAQAGSAIITVNDLPTATMTGTTTVCQNSPSPNITFTGANTTAPYTFSYRINGGPILTATTVAGNSVTVAAPTGVAGTFIYTLVSVQDGSSTACSQAQAGSATVTVNPLPTANISGTNAVCLNATSPNVTFTGAAGTAPYTFSYTINGGPVQTITTVAGNSVTIAAPTGTAGVFTYTLVSVRDASSTLCSQAQSGSAVITVNPLPTASISGVTTVCQNSPSPNITFTGANGTAPYTFSYRINGGPVLTATTIAGNSVNVPASTAAVGVFTYTLVSVQDGSSTACTQNQNGSAIVTVNPLPTASIAGTGAVCQNAASPNITFTGASTVAPYTFSYTINGGPIQTVATIAGNSVTVPVPTTTVGTYTYTLVSVQDGTATSCSQAQTGSAIITVNPIPTGLISGSKLVCINSTPPDITFTGSGGTAPYTFTYRVNGGAPQVISTTGTNTSVTLPAATSVAGTFTYKLVSVQDGSTTACVQAMNIADVTIDVSDVFPNTNFSFTNSVCLPNALVQFQNLSNIANGSPLIYSWNFGDGSPASAALNPLHQYYAVGPYNVLLHATSNAGCITDKTIQMNNIHPQPKADFSFTKPEGVCIGDAITLNDLSDGKDGVITQWNWDMGDATILTTNPITHTYTNAQTYKVTFYAVNSKGCNSDTISKFFTVHPYPVVDAGPDRFILEGGQITLSPVVTGNDLQFLWTPNQYLIDNRIEKVKVNKPATDMIYTLTVTARGGCTASDNMFVKLLKFPKIPNTFTPNNDGINDTWRIDYLNTYPDNRVQVFNRAGQLVFESRGYNTPWDGTIKGKPLPFDTYYYIIEPGNGRDPLTGYVTIIK